MFPFRYGTLQNSINKPGIRGKGATFGKLDRAVYGRMRGNIEKKNLGDPEAQHIVHCEELAGERLIEQLL